MQSINWDVIEQFATVGVAIVNPENGIIEKCNRAFSRWIHDDPTHIVGASIIDLSAPDDRDRSRLNIENLRTGRAKSITHDKRFITHSGGLFRAVQTATIMDGHLVYCVIAACEPIDECRARCEDLQQALTQLIQRQSAQPFAVNVNSEHVGGDKIGGSYRRRDSVGRDMTRGGDTAGPGDHLPGLMKTMRFIAIGLAVMVVVLIAFILGSRVEIFGTKVVPPPPSNSGE